MKGRKEGLKRLAKLIAIERGVLANRYSIYFESGREIIVTARSNEAAERKACRAVPGVKVRFSMALANAIFIRGL